MSSRDIILKALKGSSNSLTPTLLPSIKQYASSNENTLQKFEAVLKSIGGQVVRVNDWQAIVHYIQNEFSAATRIVSPLIELVEATRNGSTQADPHLLENVDLVIFKPLFAVAENGAAWITDSFMIDRALPFIAQHIALVIHADNIVPTMHEAYEKIGDSDYSYGVFIAGPSKTADIEQSLVLGAHGPKSMTVFLLD